MKVEYNDLVEKILEKHPDSRDSDFRLYGWVCAVIKPEIMKLSFEHVMWKHSELGLPAYETITRIRRKLQEKKPELRGKAYEKRHEKETEFREKYGRKYA